MKKNYVLLLLFFVFIANSYGQTIAPGCSTALPFCAGTSSQGLSFPNTTNVANVGSYSCLGSQPNPAWYYLQISQPGNLIFTISQFNTAGQPRDVDFIAWGPFVTPTCGASNLNLTTQVGCSYSPAATENFTINNAVVNQYYMVLLTNFSNQAGTITLAQTGGTGATSCDIVCPLTVSGGGVSDCIYTNLRANYLNSSTTLSTFQWTFNGVNIPAPAGTSNPLGPLGTNVSTTQTFAAGSYCVTARSPGCSTSQTAVCALINLGVPVPVLPPNDLLACNGSTFNLTQNTSVLLQGLPNQSNYVVKYNVSAINAQTNISPISPALQTVFPGSQGQRIYATVTDRTGVYCTAVVSFTLGFQFCAFSTTNSGPICSGSTFNLTATDPGQGPVTYAWTGPNGFSAIGSNVNNIPTPTGAPPFNYVCTATITAGGATLISTTTVNVNAIPVATATPLSSSICTGLTTDISLGSNVSGTTFTWTATQTNAFGSSANNGLNIAQALSTSGNTIGTVAYTITPTANGCIGTSILSTITVKPLPVAIATPTPVTICSGSNSNIILTSSPTGASFAWTAVQTDTSGASASNGSSIVQALTASGNFIGSVDYSITPTLNSCVGLPIHSIITVNPTPVAVATPVSTTICSGSATNILLSSLVTGATFAWTVSQNNVSGASAGNGTSILQTLTSTSANPGSVVYSITPTANGCLGAPITITINITTVPTAAITYAGTPFCTTLTTGQSVTLTGTAAYTGGVYSSTVGLTIDAVTGAITPSTSTPGSYLVTYTVLASAGCSAVPVTTNIVITSTPTATIIYSGTPFCTTLTTGQSVTLTGTAAYTGGVYSSTVGLTIDAVTGAIIPSTSTPGNYVVTYTIVSGAGCSQVTTTTNLVITKSPTAAITYAGTPFCTTLTTGQSATLTGTAAYTGGVYSSTVGLTIDAVTGAITPSTSTPGNYVVTYTIPATAGCSVVTTTANIVITKAPTATIIYSGTPFCTTLTTGQAVTLNGTDAYTGGTYSSTAGLTINPTTGSVTPSTSTPGNYVVTYTIVSGAGCSQVTTTTNLVITKSPTATISYSGTPFCTTLNSGQAVTLNGTAAYTGGTYSSTAGLTINPTTGSVTP
ncbi:MAG: hypothetical protein EXR18_00605, partial [Flavobacteriaceae bacterium]|nr:hypothetical protein [Flavobacteriaceae bacterium]